MDAKQNLFDIQIERYEIFKAQDSETGKFDLIFEIGGKKLLAHKYILCSISTTLDSMLSDRWTKSDEPIIIQDYTFDNFKEFITFIYSGECKITNVNMFDMMDMAEYYGVKVFKRECEKFLTKVIIDLENVNQMLELAEKYSLQKLKENGFNFISNNLLPFLKSESFFHLQKSVVKEIVERNQNTPKQEQLFESVYKWAETRALQKQKDDQNLNLNETIKEELSDILPLIKFYLMKYEFFVNFVVRKTSLFSGDQLCDLLLEMNKVYVKIIDQNGKVMNGQLQCDEIETVIRFIQSKKNLGCVYSDSDYCFWNGSQSPPSTPSKLVTNENIDWYLLYDSGNDLAVKFRNKVASNNYLIAELFPEFGFELDASCKIEVFRGF